jgi:hypothetical protein
MTSLPKLLNARASSGAVGFSPSSTIASVFRYLMRKVPLLVVKTTTLVWSLRVTGPIECNEAEKGQTRHREQRRGRVPSIKPIEN